MLGDAGTFVEAGKSLSSIPTSDTDGVAGDYFVTDTSLYFKAGALGTEWVIMDASKAF